jgi:type 1 glutamine amidotransferase
MKRLITIYLLLICEVLIAQKLPPLELTEEWKSQLKSQIPTNLKKNELIKKVLIISLATGYKHWIIPANETLITEIGKKNNFEVTIAKDISVFELDSLSIYDAVILNNTCPQKEKRTLIYDVLIERTLDSITSLNEAKRLENKLINYVNAGGGLIVLHGGLTTFNKSEKFSRFVGASFDYHPPQQAYEASIVNRNHPITAQLADSFEIYDEPYFLTGAYSDLNFQPLLSMNTMDIKNKREIPKCKEQYISWIKRYGKGKIFVSAPTHNAQSFDISGFTSFIANGINYTLGDLLCEDSSIGQ